MKIIRKINERNQITLPKRILEDLNIQPGDYVEIIRSNGDMIVRPKRIVNADELTEDEWEKLEKIVKKQIKDKQYKEYSSAKSARKHVRNIIK